MAPSAKRGGARCSEVQQYLQSRLHFIGGFGAVVGVLALFYCAELVLPRHWAVGALLRLVFLGGLGAGGYALATRVVPTALRQAASAREEEEEAPLSALDAAALEALERAKLEASERAAEELVREEEEEIRARQAAAAAAQQQRKDAAAAAAAQRRSKK